MSWTPLVEVDLGNKSESEQLKDLDELNFKNTVVNLLEGIHHELRLLNARFEEAFETQVCEEDIEE